MIKYIYMFYSNQQKLFTGNRKKQVGLHTMCVDVQHTYFLLLTWGFLKMQQNHVWWFGQWIGSVTRKLQVLKKLP